MSDGPSFPWRVACVVLWSTTACRPPEPTPSAEPPSTSAIAGPSDDGGPAPDADATTDVLTVGEAYVRAAELAGAPVVVEGTLRWAETRCASSVPSSCGGQWRMIQGEMVKGPALLLEPGTVSVPMVCIPAATEVPPRSPCAPPNVLDRHARVLVHGKLRMSGDGPVLDAERFESNGRDAQ
jgi:hypothetical protein